MKLKASINVKINLIMVCSLIMLGVVTILISSYSFKRNGKEEISGYRNAIFEEKKELLRSLVDTASDIAKYQYLAAKEDKDSLIEYKQLALDTINALRYGKDKSGYYYTVDTITRKMIQHPKASLIGKSDTFFKDADGKQQIVAQIDVAIRSGKGFDEYKWPKLNEDKPQPKLTYIKHFKEWNMAIATGIYIDD
ncbi:MAG: hypothetical protein GY705_06080, partial [Bacteroidetes bacterium]|nr:hypothetical protein [Bacteroidota bacterium]